LAAVAAWDHKPTADELLEARIADGWQPTESALQGGLRIEGYAACLVRLNSESTSRKEIGVTE
jgi:hypothetical protein